MKNLVQAFNSKYKISDERISQETQTNGTELRATHIYLLMHI